MALAQELQSEGDYDAALRALRQGVRESPDDGELRLALADVYLDLGDGALADVAVRQALERGISPARTALPSARALFLKRRYDDVLRLVTPDTMSPDDRLATELLKVRSHAAVSPSRDGMDTALTKRLLDFLERLDGHDDNDTAAGVRAEFEALRVQRLEAERAWQHHACRGRPAQAMEWQPQAREGRVLNVGPTRNLKTVAAAAAAAQDGDIVEIDPGAYPGHVAVWPQNRIIVRGRGERPHVAADGKSVENRDVWLFTGNDVVIENVEISGAHSAADNGAAIRHIGVGLTLRHVYLHDNDNGLLTGNRYPDDNEILIEYSEFARNGDGRGFAHNLYIGRSQRFELRYSHSHSVDGGHLVKTRAQENRIAYNRLVDSPNGRSSYAIDIPNGGRAVVIGNLLEQGTETLNHAIVSFGGEDTEYSDNRLVVVNNSIYNRDFEGIAVRNHKDFDVVLVNNLFGGAPLANSSGHAEMIGNLNRPEHGMREPRAFDFTLVSGATAIDRGVAFETVPEFEYVHPSRGRARPSVWRVDVGALERCGL